MLFLASFNIPTNTCSSQSPGFLLETAGFGCRLQIYKFYIIFFRFDIDLKKGEIGLNEREFDPKLGRRNTFYIFSEDMEMMDHPILRQSGWALVVYTIFVIFTFFALHFVQVNILYTHCSIENTVL